MERKTLKQKKIEIIRNETAKHGNSKERVAEILTELNNDKLETDLSNISDEGKDKLKEDILSNLSSRLYGGEFEYSE